MMQTLVALLRQRRATRAALHSGNALNRLLFTRSVPDLAHDSTGTPPTAQPGEKAGRVVTRQFLWTRITGGTGGAAPPRLAHTLSQLEDRFLRIALKISSYPIALIVVNGVITGELRLAVICVNATEHVADDFQLAICISPRKVGCIARRCMGCTACTTSCMVVEGSFSPS